MAETLTEQDLLERAKSLAPQLAERRDQAYRDRTLPDETVRELIEAGFFRACQPAQGGGYQLPFGTQTSIGIELARFCGSSGWIASVIGSHHWIVGKFEPEAQLDVWGDQPTALVASAFASAGATATLEDGGYRISGRWLFASGIQFSDWCLILARPPAPDSDDAEMRFMLVPKRDFNVEDSWTAVGMRGTGSHDLTIEDAFVPAHRTLSHAAINEIDTPGSVSEGGETFRLPFAGIVSFCVSAPTIGLAAGAMEVFRTEMGSREGILAGRLAANTNLQVRTAEASAEVDCAKLLYDADIAEMRRRSAAGASWSSSDVARFERDASYIGVLNRRAVARLAEAMGAKGLAEDNFVHRAFVDVQAACSHISMVWDANAQPYGRALLGADGTTLFGHGGSN